MDRLPPVPPPPPPPVPPSPEGTITIPIPMGRSRMGTVTLPTDMTSREWRRFDRILMGYRPDEEAETADTEVEESDFDL